MSETGIQLQVSTDDPDVAYLKLPTVKDGDARVVARTVRLRDLVGPYQGADIHFDFDEAGRLLGIEILA